MTDDSLDVSELANLGKLFEQCRPRLLAMLQRRMDPRLARRVSAEDILNDTFVTARGRWKSFTARDETTPYAWLYRLARDQLFEAWRRENRQRRDLHRDMPWPEQTSIQLGLNLVEPGTSPTEAARREELCERIRQMMSLLREADREILWMRHHDQLSFREAAEVLGITQNAANVRYARALRRLKELWETLESQQ